VTGVELRNQTFGPGGDRLWSGQRHEGSVLIRVPLLEYSRNAAETRSFDNTYSVRRE
jgi:hypothetical protein